MESISKHKSESIRISQDAMSTVPICLLLTSVNTHDAVLHDRQGISGIGFVQLVAAREAIWQWGMEG